MQTRQPNLFTRHDTIFGVCEGLGEDLGIHPNILRLAFPLLLFVNPVATIAGYAAAGTVVFATRKLIPNPRPAVSAQATAPLAAANEGQAESLPMAA